MIDPKLPDNRSSQERELAECVLSGNVERAKQLLGDGVPMTWCGPFHQSMLSAAISKQNERMVKLLIDFGVDVHKAEIDILGTPLESAVKYPNVKVTEALIAAGASPQDGTYNHAGFGRTRAVGLQGLFWQAIKHGKTDQMELVESAFGAFDAANLGTRLLWEVSRATHAGMNWGAIAFLFSRGVPIPERFWYLPDFAKLAPHLNMSSPIPAIDWTQPVCKLSSIAPEHLLRRANENIRDLEKKEGQQYFRAATKEELIALHSLGLRGVTLEYFAHFMPIDFGPTGRFKRFEWLILDTCPQEALLRCGFFDFASTLNGDFLAFAVSDEQLSVYRISHEGDIENQSCDELKGEAELLAPSIAAFFEAPFPA